MSVMSSTSRATLTDAVIKRLGADKDIRQITEANTGLLFRYSTTDRARGSFHLRHYQDGRERWAFVARWPQVTTKQAREIHRTMKATLYTDPKAPAILDRFDTLSDLMDWHINRVTKSPDLTQCRKAGVKAMARVILSHLSPCTLQELTRHRVDDLLIQPMRSIYKAAYVRSVLGVLRQATKAATAINLLTSDPLAGWTYGDFVSQRIQANAPKMNQNDLRPLIDSIPPLSRASMLVMLQLMWGTRIGETIALKWHWIDRDGMVVRIPAKHTKTGQQHDIPLTQHAVDLLNRWRKSQPLRWHVFAGNKGQPVSLSTAHKDIKAISQGEWKSHELRKLARTLWGDLGVPHHVAERMLNHAVSGLDKIYNAAQMEKEKRQAMNLWHDHLNTLNLFIR